MYFTIPLPFDDSSIDELLAFECGVDDVRVNSATLLLGKDGYYRTRSKKNIPAQLAMLLLNGRIYKQRNPSSVVTGRLFEDPMGELCRRDRLGSLDSDSVCIKKMGYKAAGDYDIELALAQMFTAKYYGVVKSSEPITVAGDPESSSKSDNPIPALEDGFSHWQKKQEECPADNMFVTGELSFSVDGEEV